jgi:hypothetical protein
MNSSPACGTSVRPWISTGIDGAGLVDRLAVLVEHGADSAEARAGQHDIAALQRAALHQHGRDRAAALVELGFDDEALGHRLLRRLQLEHLGLQQHLLEQRVDALAGLRETGTKGESPPKSSGTTLLGNQLGLQRSTFASGLSILFMATTIGTLAAFAWAMASFVCGMTPSSAATTRMTMSSPWRRARASP